MKPDLLALIASALTSDSRCTNVDVNQYDGDGSSEILVDFDGEHYAIRPEVF